LICSIELPNAQECDPAHYTQSSSAGQAATDDAQGTDARLIIILVISFGVQEKSTPHNLFYSGNEFFTIVY